jgi:hypothetical protein
MDENAPVNINADEALGQAGTIASPSPILRKLRRLRRRGYVRLPAKAGYENRL